MDSHSPDFTKTKPTASSLSDSPPPPPLVQESPIFSYISNLSPIKTVEPSPHIPQGFPGLSSPSLVFTSPQIKPHSETSFLKRRRQHAELSFAEIPKTRIEGKNFPDGPVPITQLQLGSDNKTKDFSQTHPCSSSGLVDDYLDDPTEVDVNSSQSVNLCLEYSTHVPESSSSGLIKPKELNKNYTATDSRTEFQEPFMISGQAQGKQTFDAKPTGSKDMRDDELPLNSGSSVGNASRREYHQDMHDKLQGLEGEHQENCDYTPQSPSETLQTNRMYEECAENVGSIAGRLNENVVVKASKRRCLWFEEAPPCSSREGDGSLSLPEKFYCSEAPVSTVESEMLESSMVELRTNFSKSQMAATLPPRSFGKSPLTVSKPTGIGLHLNSIVNAASVGRGAASIKLADSYLGVQVMKSASITVRRYPISNVVEKDFAGAVECRNEFETSVAASSATTQSPHSGEFVYHGPIHENRKSDIHSVDSYEECNQSSPIKKRKRSSRSIDNDGCKRCNCSKTKCLKLYCDCFAAGLYCDQNCCCKECFNKPEYEDTVLETRQKIESRNPLAFAPKVLEHVDENQFTPASARHKRGCSCKKSLCLKRYCECYQSNVGCSNGCRCEGCQNTYGTRGEFVDMEPGAAEETTNGAVVEVRDSTFDEKLQMVAKRKYSNDSLNLTLMTPALQRSLDTNNISNSRVLQTRCTPSPQSDLTIISRYETSNSPQRNSENSDNLLDTSKESLDMGSYDWRADYENIEIPESCSPRCDAAPTTCHLTPLSGPESMTVASASFTTKDFTKASQVQLRPQSQCLMSCNSLHWHSSPVNPMPLLDGVKSFQGLDSEKGLCEVMQDDTPEILKDTSMPIKSVKVSSPNKKRVSPPHSHNHELGASSSGGLRSGRKFILKAVGSKGSSTIQNMSSLLQDKDRKR